MAGLMKFACLVLACMIVTTAKADLDCSTVTSKVKPCVGYVTEGGPLSKECCTGVSNLNSMVRSTADRQQACRCLQETAKALGSTLDADRAAGLPKACGVSVPYAISTNTNCNTVE